MFYLKLLIAALSTALLTLTPAFADDDQPTTSMVSLMRVFPAKGKIFDDAWKVIQKSAIENDYPYTEYVGGHANARWIVTPIKNFADVDTIIAARRAAETAGGTKVEIARAQYNNALISEHTFFMHYDKDLSYKAASDKGGRFMEIDIFRYKHDKKAEMTAALANYKAFIEEKNGAYSFDLYWGGIGAGNAIIIITYAADRIAMAKRDAAMAALVQSEKAGHALIWGFRANSLGLETIQTYFNAKASINVQDAGN